MVRLRNTLLATVAAVALHAGAANANLVEADLFAVGDKLLTMDTATGLEWLDVDATLGLSYNDIVDGDGGWAALGFSHATRAQVEALYASVGLTTRFNFASNYDGASELVQKLGCTFSCGSGNDGHSAAMLVDLAPLDLDQGQVRIRNSASQGSMTIGLGQSPDQITMGHYMVRVVTDPNMVQAAAVSYMVQAAAVAAVVQVASVPVPAALPLFGTAIAALGIFGWRRRTKA